jgi:trans-aconitate methyltransferase
MVPYLERIPVEKHEAFFARYREQLRAKFPDRPVFFGFRRILIGATKEK